MFILVIPRDEHADQKLSLRDTPIVTMVNSAVFVTATVSATICWVSWVVTFTPWARLMPSAYFVPFFTLAFPLFFWAIFVANSPRGGQSRRREAADLLEAVPRGARVLIAVTFAAAATSFVIGMAGLPGQPGYDPSTHRYSYDDHGTLIPATRAGYLHAVAAQDRLFLGGAMLFTTVAAAVTYQERKRRRELGLPARYLHPTKPRPKLPVPFGVLVLAAAIGLAGAVPSAGLIIARVDAWGANATYLHAGHPARVLLRPDDYVVFVGCPDDMACPPLDPSGVSVQVVHGGAVEAIPDPSSDHDSENGQPFIGAVSFAIPRTELVQIALAASPGQPVFVVPSEGEEAHALAGWIILLVLSLATLIAALVGLIRLLIWRLGFGT